MRPRLRTPSAPISVLPMRLRNWFSTRQAASAWAFSAPGVPGKSTVVQLLQNQLETRESCTVWVFDAWAHEGDSLRRTFLESLIERLTGKAWLKDQAWDERLQYLAGRRKVTEQASRPRLSPLAIVLAISLLFVPIGGSLFDNRLDAGLSVNLSQSPDWLAIAGLLLAFAPLVVLLLYVGGLLVVRRSANAVKESLRDALTVFVRQTDTSQRTETLDSGEPTTLEFERAFFDVMAAALTPAESRRRPGRGRCPPSRDRDRQPRSREHRAGARRVVHASDLRASARLARAVARPLCGVCCHSMAALSGGCGPRRVHTASNVAESFLDKTFQVRFEVPLPLLSNWKDYLMARLKDAMPSHTDDEFFRVYRLYTVRRKPGALSPTPRELKLFVNQVGSLHRQWQDTIPLPDLAYSVLLQRDGESITFETIGQFPAPRELGLVSMDAREHLAALAYGVPGKAAQQLLLQEPILRALEAPEPQTSCRARSRPTTHSGSYSIRRSSAAVRSGRRLRAAISCMPPSPSRRVRFWLARRRPASISGSHGSLWQPRSLAVGARWTPERWTAYWFSTGATPGWRRGCSATSSTLALLTRRGGQEQRSRPSSTTTYGWHPR